MPDLSLFISKTGFCFFIIPILCSRARQFVRSKLHIFDKIRHRIRNHKKPAEFAVENRRKIFIYSLRCMSHLRLRARAFQPYTLSARRMTESARRCAVPSVGSRGYVLASSTMRVRDRSLGDSFRRFLVGEKTTSLFSFGKERMYAFLLSEKSTPCFISLRFSEALPGKRMQCSPLSFSRCCRAHPPSKMPDATSQARSAWK